VNPSPRQQRDLRYSLRHALDVSLWLALFATVWFLLLLLMGACAKVPTPTPAQGVGNGLSAIEVRRQVIEREAGIAKVKVDGQPLRAIQTIEVETGAMKADVADAQQANSAREIQHGEQLAKASKLLNEANDARARIEQKLKDEQTHWVGYRTRTLLPWILGIAGGVWLAVNIFAGKFAAMQGILGWIAKTLIGLFPAMNLSALWARFLGSKAT
jgi:hypothetical protein